MSSFIRYDYDNCCCEYDVGMFFSMYPKIKDYYVFKIDPIEHSSDKISLKSLLEPNFNDIYKSHRDYSPDEISSEVFERFNDSLIRGSLRYYFDTEDLREPVKECAMYFKMREKFKDPFPIPQEMLGSLTDKKLKKFAENYFNLFPALRNRS